MKESLHEQLRFATLRGPRALLDRQPPTNRYPSVEDFITDVKLVWYNAYLYNKPGSVVHDAARDLESVFDHKLEALVASSAGFGTPSSSGADGADVVPHTLIRPIIKSLQSHALSKPFRVPVDIVALKLPHYLQVITRPMDLLTVSTNLEQGAYGTVAEVRGAWGGAKEGGE
jgi:hypothetical protein